MLDPTKVLAMAVLGSLTLNAYLLAFTDGDDTSADGMPLAETLPTSSSRARMPASPPSLTDAAASDVPPEIAKLDRAGLEQRLIAVEAKLDKILPLEEKFEREERSPENEGRLKPFLDKVFATKADAAPSYDLACHGRYCKITPRKNAPEEWFERIQTEPDGFGLSTYASLGPQRVFLQLADPEPAAANQFIAKLLTEMRAETAKAIADCKAANPAPGSVAITIVLDAGTLRVEATGPLADQVGGICIRRVFEDRIATETVPRGVTSIPKLPITIEVP
jgi:hypothetical protein